jgi:hypothetical protein
MAKKSYGQVWQFDFQPLKVKNRPDFLAWRWRATYHWKDFDKGYNFASNLILIGGLHIKWCPLKIVEVPTLIILRIVLGSPGTKCHLGVSLVARHRVYYKGEGGGFLKFGPWWVFWIRVCPWSLREPKVLKLCTNQLVLWFVQVRVNN